MKRKISLLLRENLKRRMARTPKDFYDRFKNIKEKEEIRLKNRRISSTMDHLAGEFDFKKELEESFRTEISSQMIDSIEEDPIKKMNKKKKEILDFVEDQKRKMITTEEVFGSGNKIKDLDKANRILEGQIHRVGL